MNNELFNIVVIQISKLIHSRGHSTFMYDYITIDTNIINVIKFDIDIIDVIKKKLFTINLEDFDIDDIKLQSQKWVIYKTILLNKYFPKKYTIMKYNMNASSKIIFQHSKIMITRKTYNYVKRYKHELFKNITQVLKKHNIKFVIGYGNLLEYVRGEPIIHDDDIDIRFDIEDFPKWENYCRSLKNKFDKENNLIYNDRFHNFRLQKHKGIVVKLYKFDSKGVDYNKSIWCDLIPSVVSFKFWNDYKIFHKPLIQIKYLESVAYIPDKKLTNDILTKTYGKNYLIPNVDYSKFRWL